MRLDDLDGGHRHDEQLRDAHAGLDGERALVVGVEQDHAHLAAVAGVDHPGRVDDREAVAQGEPRARNDEAGVALGDLDRDAGADRGPLPRADRDLLARAEVEARIAAVGSRRQHRVVAELHDAQLGHVVAADSRSSPATR